MTVWESEGEAAFGPLPASLIIDTSSVSLGMVVVDFAIGFEPHSHQEVIMIIGLASPRIASTLDEGLDKITRIST